MTIGPRFHARTKHEAKERRRYIQKDLFPAVQRALASLGPQSGPGPGQAELTNIQVFGSYMASGRVVFDFHKRLSAALLDTDVEAIPLSAIPRPADAFYLHFGVDSGLCLDGDTIEGAFVAWAERQGEPPKLVVDFAREGQFSSKLFWSLEAGEPMAGCLIDLSEPDRGVIAALENSAAEMVKRYESAMAQMDETKRRLEEQYGEVASIPSPISRLGQNLPLLKRGLSLVVNCLLYLGAAPEDLHEQWDDRSDATLVDQATNATKPGTRKTAERTLANRGYVKIRLVGHQFAASQAGQAFGDSGRTVATHFRRGHFRNQPYGPERSMHKLIFIPPVVVNPGQSEPPGRIYEV